MLRISIVTISYNQAEFLERTIKSVIAQEYPAIEYIIVDPGSTDGSREIIQRYRSIISTVIYERDSGAADGLNRGFAVSTGDVLGFLNSDDVLYPGAVSNAIAFLNSNQDVDVVSGHAKIIDRHDKVLRLVYSDRMSVKKYLYGSVVLMQPSTFFRRSTFLKAGGFNVDNKATWDGELFLEMARAGATFELCDTIWSGYRLHSQSITSSRKMEQNAAADYNRIFRLIVGRNFNRRDKVLQILFRGWKHLANPRDTYERILRGPIYGRTTE